MMAGSTEVTTAITTTDNTWKMTRYMRGVSVPGFASFLGSVGVVTSLKFILDAINLLVLERMDPDLDFLRRNLFSSSLFLLSIHMDYETVRIVVGIFELLLNIGMLVFSCKLWKKVSDNNMVGMRSLVKIGCYIMAGLELFLCLLINIIIWMAYVYHYVIIIDVIVTLIAMVFSCLLIVGVRKVMSGLVIANIIFKIIFFFIFTIVAIVALSISISNKEYVMYVVNVYLCSGWLIFYSSSFIVLHYNIMLHDQQGYEIFQMEERQKQDHAVPSNW